MISFLSTETRYNYLCNPVFGKAHEILILVAYAQKPLLNHNAEVSSGAKGLNFGPSVRLYPNFVHASSKCLSESVHENLCICPGWSEPSLPNKEKNLLY